MTTRSLTFTGFPPVLGLLALMLGAEGAWSADQLYRWVDEAGVVHFSDAPPAGSTGPVEVQPLPAPATTAFPSGDGDYSVLNQVKRMEQDRLQREALRREEELRRLELEKSQADAEAARARARQAELEAERAASPNVGYPIYPRWHHHRRHRDDSRDDAGRTRVQPVKPDPSFLSSPDRILTRPGRSLEPVVPAR